MARILSVTRWVLLAIAVLFLCAGLFSVFKAPPPINWTYRVAIAGFVGECGYRYLFVPAVVAILALALSERESWRALCTFACAVAAFSLWAKPVLQAWALGYSLPVRLGEVFAGGKVDRAPFSFRTLYAPQPEPMPFEDGVYRPNRRMEIIRAIGRSPAPCVISLHGGGWFGEGFRDRRPFNLWLARHGYCVVSIAYSALPSARWPEPRDDVLAAIKVLRERAAELGIDPNKIVLLGRSAGAQLALATAYTVHDPGIRGVVAFYPPTDLDALWRAASRNERLNGYTQRQIFERLLGGTPDTAKTAYENSSPVTLADRQSPPTLLIHGALDSLVPLDQSQQLAEKLSALGRSNALLVIPWASHGFDTINFDGPGGQITTYAVAQFLDTVTR